MYEMTHITTFRALIVSVVVAILCSGCKTTHNKKEDKQEVALVESVPEENHNDAEVLLEEDGLPTKERLISAKLSALKTAQEEQDKILSDLEQKVMKDQRFEQGILDNNAYLSLSIHNTAPRKDYALEKTEVYVDGKLFARGGSANLGLPRKSELYYGAIEPGCHKILVKATYIRLKNDIISRFKVNRVEEITKEQSFIAKNGYRVTIAIEGFEAHNTLLNWYRGPDVKFRTAAQANFLQTVPLISLNELFDQGRVHIEYLTEEVSGHELIQKSVSIDGLPILVKQAQTGDNTIFDAPINEGRHTLNVVLLFGQKKRSAVGPRYNFRLSFNRDFYVLSGQTTEIKLAGMPANGFSTAEKNRYGRVTTKILPSEDREFFPTRCIDSKEQRANNNAEHGNSGVSSYASP